MVVVEEGGGCGGGAEEGGEEEAGGEAEEGGWWHCFGGWLVIVGLVVERGEVWSRKRLDTLADKSRDRISASRVAAKANMKADLVRPRAPFKQPRTMGILIICFKDRLRDISYAY